MVFGWGRILLGRSLLFMGWWKRYETDFEIIIGNYA
jgi:hypothetical protein